MIKVQLLITAAITAILVFMALTMCRAQGEPDTEFVIAMKAYGQANTICEVNDCECWMQRVAMKRQVKQFALNFLATNTGQLNGPLQRVARAWIDDANIEASYWAQWQCTSDSQLTSEQLTSKQAQQVQVLKALQRLANEISNARLMFNTVGL